MFLIFLKYKILQHNKYVVISQVLKQLLLVFFFNIFSCFTETDGKNLCKVTVKNNTYFIPETKTTKLLALETCKNLSAEVADQNEMSSIIQAWKNPLCFQKRFVFTTQKVKNDDSVLVLFNLVSRKITQLTNKQKVSLKRHVVCRLKTDNTKTTSNKTVLVTIITLCLFFGICLLVIFFKVSNSYSLMLFFF